MKNITIADCTLRKIEEEHASMLLFKEKVAIAQLLDEVCVDRVELPLLKAGKEDAVIAGTIASSLTHAALCLPAGDSEDSIAKAYEAICGASHPVLQIVMPVSTVCMEYEYHMKAEIMQPKIVALVEKAKILCKDVEFVAKDASRADQSFLSGLLAAVQAAGADAVTLCDDAGIWMMEDCEKAVKAALEAVTIPVFVEVSNAISLGTANALAAIKAGAAGVKTCVVGKGGLKTGRFADMLIAKEEELAIETGLKKTELHHDIDEILKRVRHIKVTESVENPADSSVEVLLTKDSTLTQVWDATRSLGYELSETDAGRVYDALQTVFEKKSEIAGKELDAVIAASAMQVPSTYHLDSFVVNSSNITTPMAHVVLRKEETKIDGVAIGDGPIDAAFAAIEQSIGYHYELDDFRIEAVTSGSSDVLGSAVVRLRNRGKLYSGTGISADIVGASVRAYINALNKIVYEEK